MSHRALLALAAAALAGAAVAAPLAGADAAKDRETHMKALGAAAKALADQLRSGNPDAAIVKAQTAKISESAKALPTWFPAGSGPAAWPKSAALPVIWTDTAGFATAAHNLQVAAAKLDADAQGGDMAAVGADAKPLFGACKGCHDKFRKPEKS